MDKFLKEIIREAGYLAKGFYARGVSHSFKSSPADLVTEADTAVNDFLIEKIKERFPGQGIISEERPEVNIGAPYTWVIDPIDGTRNFANHIAVWCVMVGVVKKGVPILGAIYDAMNDELFFAQKGQGAYLNDKRIRASGQKKFRHCFFVFSAGSRAVSPRFERYAGFIKKILDNGGMWTHNYGSVLPACHLAAGRVDAVLMNAGCYHDYVAPYIITTEAGAKFTNSFGQKWKKGEKDVVIANPVLHKEIMGMF